MKRILLAVSAVCLFAIGARASKIDTLYVSSLYTTHVIFPTDLTYADLSNTKSIAAKIIEQNRNMLAVKARERFNGSCSVSALESNGSMHTFIVMYNEHPSELVIDLRNAGHSEYSEHQGKNHSGGIEGERKRGRNKSGSDSNVSTWKTGSAPLLSEMVHERQHVYHVGCREYDILALCEDISAYSDITYMILSVKNNSGISYDVSDATFVIESKHHNKRAVKYDKTVFPRSRYGKLAAGPGEYTRIVYSFDKMTLSKDQVLKVYLYENGGQRNLVMSIDTNDINKARTNI